MRVRVRYDTPNERGETRRERIYRFGKHEENRPPIFYIPIEGFYLWEWFWTISARLRRIREGLCEPIPPSEFLSWCRASGTIVTPPEYAILCAMDEIFCEETNKELEDYRTRRAEEDKIRNSISTPWKRNI